MLRNWWLVCDGVGAKCSTQRLSCQISEGLNKVLKACRKLRSSHQDFIGGGHTMKEHALSKLMVGFHHEHMVHKLGHRHGFATP